MRTKNAKNRPKYISVTLAELNKVFHPNALIQINVKYDILFKPSEEALPATGVKQVEKENDIEMTVS